MRRAPREQPEQRTVGRLPVGRVHRSAKLRVEYAVVKDTMQLLAFARNEFALGNAAIKGLAYSLYNYSRMQDVWLEK